MISVYIYIYTYVYKLVCIRKNTFEHDDKVIESWHESYTCKRRKSQEQDESEKNSKVAVTRTSIKV